MAAALKDELGVEPEYIKSSGGVFEIVRDEKLIFSKKATGRFPTHDEIIEKLKA